MLRFLRESPVPEFRSRWQPSALIRASFALHGVALLAVIAYPAAWPWELGAVLVNQTWLTLAGLWPRSRGLGPNITRLPASAAAKNQIVLSIDDGPDPDVTPRVLDILDRHAVRATFFCVGAKAERYPQLCREIVQRGHTVENHTQHHSHRFAFSGMGGFAREIEAAQATLTRITGRTPVFFRAPAGLRNPLLDPVLSKLGLRLVAWSCRAFDTRRGAAAAVSHKLIQGATAGAILLLHDGNSARTPSGTPVIVEALPALLEAAAGAGLRFVTLSDALDLKPS
jgi:peptidoglycan/xylan/chitin deacetylase (PgdA/CDA1 family)